VTERDGDREHARPLPRRHAIEIAHHLREEIVRIELLNDQLQERTRPGERRRASRKRADGARTKLLPPSVSLALLVGPCGFFQVLIEVDEGVTDLAHGSSEHLAARVNARVPVQCGGPRQSASRRWV
jgi:hypothetical protein